MKSAANTFLKAPHTQLGWWSVGLTLLFVVLFIGVATELIPFSGFLTLTLGVIAAVITLLALIWKHERSWLLWLMLLPALFAMTFALDELLLPH